MIQSKRNFFKIKVALFFGYNGKGFQGLQSQKDPNVKTIEKSLIEGLAEAKLISEMHKEELNKISWGRGARTDKGVHALCNGISLKMSIPEEYLLPGSPLRAIMKEGAELEEEIQQKNKEILEKEAYKPSEDGSQNNNEKVMQTEEIAKPIELEIQEEKKKNNEQESQLLQNDHKAILDNNNQEEDKTLKKIEIDEINRQKNEENRVISKVQQDFAAERRKCIDVEKIIKSLNSQLPWDIRAIAIKQVTKKFDIRLHCKFRVYEYLIPLFVFQKYDDLKEGKPITLEEEKAILEKVNHLALKFKGTHKYFNYTKAIKAKDPRCSRYILNMETQLFENDGQKYVRFTLQGQSFIYHQIRKMIGMICLMVQQGHPDSYLEDSLEKTPTNVWLAPAHGLYLNRMRFDGYNKKDEIPEPIEFNENEESRINEMRELIEKAVLNKEETTALYKQWLQNYIEGRNIPEDNDSVSGDGQDS